jgi:phage terminase large subunit-like protein
MEAAILNAGTKELMRMTLARVYSHGGNLLLRWMAANCVAQRARDGKVKPGKKSKNARIDLTDCLVMAVDRLMRHHQEPSRGKVVRHARLRGRRMRDALRLFE